MQSRVHGVLSWMAKEAYSGALAVLVSHSSTHQSVLDAATAGQSGMPGTVMRLLGTHCIAWYKRSDDVPARAWLAA